MWNSLQKRRVFLYKSIVFEDVLFSLKSLSEDYLIVKCKLVRVLEAARHKSLSL